MKVFILSNDDLTSNIIFSGLFEDSNIEVTGIAFTTTLIKKNETKLTSVLNVFNKTVFNYWLFLIITNGFFKISEYLSLNFKKKYNSTWFKSIKQLAKNKNIPIYYSNNFNSEEFIKIIKNHNPDIIAIRVNQILKKKIIELPKLGIICAHSSLLPSYKGIAAEFHALSNTEKKIGTSIFKVELELDKGPIISQKSFSINKKRSLFYHIIKNNIVGKFLLRESINDISTKLNNNILNNKYESSYYSWPDSKSYRSFRNNRFKLLSINDLIFLIRKVFF